MGSASANPLGVEWFGLVMGLGFVLSFGYWCTDFLVVQRAMAADSMLGRARTPLIAAVPKMFFPFLVILPGMIAIAYCTHASAGARRRSLPAGVCRGNGRRRQTARPTTTWPSRMMLGHYFPTGMLGLGLTALLASFMSGMAGNVTAFNTVWTYDIYQAYIRPGATDEHYLWMGRVATVFGIAISIAAAYVATRFNNIMDVLQLVFGFVNAPLFATFLLGMFWKRATGHGAFSGLLSGTMRGRDSPRADAAGRRTPGYQGRLAALMHTYPSEMAQNFWTAIFAWTTCFVVTIIVSCATPRDGEDLSASSTR